jgi:PAS domain S-box-containing protein
MIVLGALDLPGSYESPYLLMALNLVFSTLGSGFVAYLIGRSFSIRGTLGLLMLGCGVIAWGSAGFIGVATGLVGLAAGQFDINVFVTIHNSCVWMSALCHLAGAVLSLRPRRAMREANLWLAAAYTITLGCVGLVTLSALAGWTPTFFVQGEGGTLLRYFVLGSATAMFVLSAVLLKGASRRPLSAFLYWYTLALGLIAVGLFGIMIELVHAGPLSWTGRTAQFLGSAYMLVAAIASVREARVWGIPLEAALRESEDQFRLLVEGLKDYAIYMLDLNGRVMTWNAGAERLKGYTPQEIVGRHFSRFYPPEDVAAGKPERELTIAIEQGQHAEEGWRIRKDGTRFWAEVTITAIHNDSGDLRGFAKLVRDISERKRAEEALWRSEGRWNAAIENFGEGAIIADEAEQVIYWNPAARRLHGFTSKTDGVGPLKETPLTFELRTPDGQHVLALDEWPMRRIKRGETVHNLELRLRRPDQGWEKIVSYSGAMVETTGGERLIFLSVYDLTELRRVEAELERLAQQRQIALGAARMGWWHYDPITRIASWDERYKEIFGVTGSQCSNDEILTRLHPEDLPGVWAKVEAAMDPLNPQPYSAARWIDPMDRRARQGSLRGHRRCSAGDEPRRHSGRYYRAQARGGGVADDHTEVLLQSFQHVWQHFARDQ